MRALLDTNVLSELAKKAPNPIVHAFYSNDYDLWVSVITLYELRYGAELVKEPEKRQYLTKFVADTRQKHSDRLLPVTPPIAESAGAMRAYASRKGRVLDPEDALIAATAHTHNLILVTRNISDFEITGIPIFNPWNPTTKH